MFVNTMLTIIKANIEHTFITADNKGTILHINDDKREKNHKITEFVFALSMNHTKYNVYRKAKKSQ